MPDEMDNIIEEKKDIGEIKIDTAKIFRLDSESEKLMNEGKNEEAKKKLEQAKKIIHEMFSLENFMVSKLSEEFDIKEHLYEYLEDLENRVKAVKVFIKQKEDESEQVNDG